MTKRPTPNWKALRDLLYRRACGRCEVSGVRLDFDTFDLHHRRNKGMGGTSRPDTDLPGNLLALDPIVHNGGPGSVHAHRIISEGYGWLVPKLCSRAAGVPVLVALSPHDFLWVLLDDAGNRHPLGEVMRGRPPAAAAN